MVIVLCASMYSSAGLIQGMIQCSMTTGADLAKILAGFLVSM